MSNNNGVQSVNKVLNILEEIVYSDEELGITNISKRLNIHKSTVHRLLNTLKLNDYVEQNKVTGNYKIGIKLMKIAGMILDKLEIRKIANPFLKELMFESKETVHLVIRNKRKGVYIDKVESTQTIRMHSEIGKTIPLYCTSVGKVLLSDLNRDNIEKMYSNIELKAYTDNTITDLNVLINNLEKVKEQGYAIDNEEYENQVICIAAPIRDYTKNIVASVSISGPVFRIDDDKISNLIELTKKTAFNISEKLGYY